MAPAARSTTSLAPEPPPRFRGAFVGDDDARQRMGQASGPFRLRPRAVATPTDADDVAELVTWAGQAGHALIPRGAGTGMPGGNVGPGVSVDLTRLNQVEILDAERGLIAAGAGAIASEVDRVARTLGRFVPALPSSADRCTIGGMVANNAAGARSYSYGAIHAWVASLEVVLADGTVHRVDEESRLPGFDALRTALAPDADHLLDAWPRVRKNSSGYALDRFLGSGAPLPLLVGSEGTLGVVTRTVLRTAPVPRDQALVLLPLPDLDALDQVLARLVPARPSACEFFGTRFVELAGLRNHSGVGDAVANHPGVLLLELDDAAGPVPPRLETVTAVGRSLGVDARVGRTAEERDGLWKVRHAASPVVASKAAEGRISMQIIEDSVVPPGRLSHYVRGLETLLGQEETDAVIFGHAGDGNLHVNPLVDVRRPDWRDRVGRILEGTVELVASLGGTLSGEHGDGRLRAPFHPRIFGAELTEAFATVKRTLDPGGVLNPGVVVPLPGQDPLDGITPERRVG